MRVTEFVKYVVYRTPIVNWLMCPSYNYKVSPGQLCALIELINFTRNSGGAIAEIGVAQGDSSVFLLEHLKTTGDRRRVYLFDTFSGFTNDSIDYEIRRRNKVKTDYDKFQYGSEVIFRKNLERSGYSDFTVVKGDASRYDWSSIAPIAAVLLDIDLYKPTIEILRAIWPHIVEGGGILVDDCLADSPWDGSLQAYQEFIEEKGLPFVRVGNKAGLVRRT